MKKLLTLSLIIITILAGLLVWQMRKNQTSAAASPPTKADEPESRISHGTNGDTIVKIDPATRELMGLQTAPLSSVKIAPEMKAFGRVIDPILLSTIVSDFLSARAAADVSQKELQRLKILAGQNNASARTVEAAEGGAQRDATIVEMARFKLAAAMGNVVASNTNLVEFVKSLASGETALITVDPPGNNSATNVPTIATFVAVAEKGTSVQGKFIGAPLGVDSQTQKRSYLFLVETNQSRFAAGESVIALLPKAGDAEAGYSVPDSAILRFNGATWIYLQSGEDRYQRCEVKLERPMDSSWFATLTADAQAKIVTVGAQQLLSEELKSQLSGD